jgi:repressor LexA
MTKAQPAITPHEARLPLTDRQQALVDFVRTFTDEHHYPPTFEEIRVGLQWSTRSLVGHHAHEARAKGWVTFEVGKTRTIRLVDETDSQPE